MRYLMAAIALTPFIAVMVAMVTGRARVRACCAPLISAEEDEPRPSDARPPVSPG